MTQPLDQPLPATKQIVILSTLFTWNSNRDGYIVGFDNGFYSFIKGKVIWGKVFKNGPSEICGRQTLKFTSATKLFFVIK